MNEVLKKTFIVCVNPTLILQNGQNSLIQCFKKLPNEIDEVRIQRFDGKFAFNEKTEGGGVTNMRDVHISHILINKDEKLKKYQFCDTYWLVITEGNYYAGTFNEIQVKTPVNSNFDKVFLLRDGKHQLIELK